MSRYETLGNHIKLVDARNKDMVTKKVVGISIDKYFMPSVANIIGTDLSNYKLITNGIFACNPMHVGRDERLPVALYTDDVPAIVSPAYFMFRIINEKVLNPEFLMMWFRRAEFDRNCWFLTDSSVRGGITWEDLCRLEIPILPYNEQLKLVNDYRIITARLDLLRRINDNLEAQAQSYFDLLFIDNKNSDCTLADISVVNPIRSLQKGTVAKCFEMSTLPTSGCIPIGGELKAYNGGVRFINGDTIIARITPCLENGKAAYINILDEGEVAFGSTEYIVFAATEGYPSSFYYFLIRNSQFVQFALQFMNGSSGRQRVSGEELASFSLKRPNHEQLLAFARVGNIVLEQMRRNVQESQSLRQLQNNQIAKLSC